MSQCTERKRFALKTLLATIKTACAVLAVTAHSQMAVAMDVTNDMGGSIQERLEQVQRLTAQGTPVRIVGTCVSACTLYLGVPTSCVFPNARLGFHGPSTRLQGIPLPREEYERVSYQMAAEYPEPLRSWFLSDARRYTSTYILISGSDAIAMGARACV